MDFIDPDNVPDTFVAGYAWIEPLAHGMVRMWAYSEEQSVRIIRVKLVLPSSRAREINHFIRGELEKLSTLRLVR